MSIKSYQQKGGNQIVGYTEKIILNATIQESDDQLQSISVANEPLFQEFKNSINLNFGFLTQNLTNQVPGAQVNHNTSETEAQLYKFSMTRYMNNPNQTDNEFSKNSTEYQAVVPSIKAQRTNSNAEIQSNVNFEFPIQLKINITQRCLVNQCREMECKWKNSCNQIYQVLLEKLLFHKKKLFEYLELNYNFLFWLNFLHFVGRFTNDEFFYRLKLISFLSDNLIYSPNQLIVQYLIQMELLKLPIVILIIIQRPPIEVVIKLTTLISPFSNFNFFQTIYFSKFILFNIEIFQIIGLQNSFFILICILLSSN